MTEITPDEAIPEENQRLMGQDVFGNTETYPKSAHAQADGWNLEKGTARIVVKTSRTHAHRFVE
jgi:hypothetical protein